MRLSRLKFLLGLLLCVSPFARAELAPSNVSVSLQLPQRAELGDAIVGRLVATNIGDKPYDLWPGRPWLKVKVTDATGRVLPDVTRYETAFGVIAAAKKLSPLESTIVAFGLNEIVALTQPGLYTVSQRRDPDEKGNEPDLFEKATIELTLPTAKAAAQRVRALCDKPDWANRRQLERLQHPIYLPALVVEAKAGRAIACLGLKRIPTAEANRALLKLAASSRPAVAIAAADILTWRLPWLERPDLPVCRDWFDSDPREEILKTWRAEFDEPLLTVASKLLKNAVVSAKASVGKPVEYHFRANAIFLGGQMITARGRPDQAPVLLAAIQRALEIPIAVRNSPQANIVDDPGDLFTLMEAAAVLGARGWHMVREGTLAEKLVGLSQLAMLIDQRSEDGLWKRRVREALKHEHPVLRKYALQAIPMPITDEWETPMLEALRDPDWGVVLAACRVAGMSGRKSLSAPLVQIVRTIPSVESDAEEAALALGAKSELCEVWCERITDRQQMSHALEQLILATIDLPPRSGSGNGGSGFTKQQQGMLQEAWRTFLATHRGLLASGRLVSRDDPSLVPVIEAMRTGTDFVEHISLRDGTYWPGFGDSTYWPARKK